MEDLIVELLLDLLDDDEFLFEVFTDTGGYYFGPGEFIYDAMLLDVI